MGLTASARKNIAKQILEKLDSLDNDWKAVEKQAVENAENNSGDDFDNREIIANCLETLNEAYYELNLLGNYIPESGNIYVDKMFFTPSLNIKPKITFADGLGLKINPIKDFSFILNVIPDWSLNRNNKVMASETIWKYINLTMTQNDDDSGLPIDGSTNMSPDDTSDFYSKGIKFVKADPNETSTQLNLKRIGDAISDIYSIYTTGGTPNRINYSGNWSGISYSPTDNFKITMGDNDTSSGAISFTYTSSSAAADPNLESKFPLGKYIVFGLTDATGKLTSWQIGKIYSWNKTYDVQSVQSPGTDDGSGNVTPGPLIVTTNYSFAIQKTRKITNGFGPNANLRPFITFNDPNNLLEIFKQLRDKYVSILNSIVNLKTSVQEANYYDDKNILDAAKDLISGFSKLSFATMADALYMKNSIDSFSAKVTNRINALWNCVTQDDYLKQYHDAIIDRFDKVSGSFFSWYKQLLNTDELYRRYLKNLNRVAFYFKKLAIWRGLANPTNDYFLNAEQNVSKFYPDPKPNLSPGDTIYIFDENMAEMSAKVVKISAEILEGAGEAKIPEDGGDEEIKAADVSTMKINTDKIIPDIYDIDRNLLIVKEL
jgi:hypothetical protein